MSSRACFAGITLNPPEPPLLIQNRNCWPTVLNSSVCWSLLAKARIHIDAPWGTRDGTRKLNSTTMLLPGSNWSCRGVPVWKVDPVFAPGEYASTILQVAPCSVVAMPFVTRTLYRHVPPLDGMPVQGLISVKRTGY